MVYPIGSVELGVSDFQNGGRQIASTIELTEESRRNREKRHGTTELAVR